MRAAAQDPFKVLEGPLNYESLGAVDVVLSQRLVVIAAPHLQNHESPSDGGVDLDRLQKNDAVDKKTHPHVGNGTYLPHHLRALPEKDGTQSQSF